MKSHPSISSNVSIKVGVVILFVLVLTLGVFYKNLSPTPLNASADMLKGPMDMANYVRYNPGNLQRSKARGTSILFFAATNWCQECSELEREIVNRSSEIPLNTTILKVDYDNDKKTPQQWAVTQQHTLVVIDPDGKEIVRWVGGDFETVLRKLQTI